MLRKGQVVSLRYNGVLFAPAALVSNVQERPGSLPLVGVIAVNDHGTSSAYGSMPPAAEIEASGRTGYGWDWAAPDVIAVPEPEADAAPAGGEVTG